MDNGNESKDGKDTQPQGFRCVSCGTFSEMFYDGMGGVWRCMRCQAEQPQSPYTRISEKDAHAGVFDKSDIDKPRHYCGPKFQAIYGLEPEDVTCPDCGSDEVGFNYREQEWVCFVCEEEFTLEWAPRPLIISSDYTTVICPFCHWTSPFDQLGSGTDWLEEEPLMYRHISRCGHLSYLEE